MRHFPLPSASDAVHRGLLQNLSRFSREGRDRSRNRVLGVRATIVGGGVEGKHHCAKTQPTNDGDIRRGNGVQG